MKLPPPEKIPHDSFSTDDEFETLINGEYPPESDAEHVRKWIMDFDHDRRQCPYCRSALNSRVYDRGSVDGGDNWGRFAQLSECENCKYWHCFVNQYSEMPMLSSVGWYAWISKVQEFDVKLPAGCSSEIAQGLRQHRLRWETLEPRRLEKLVADVFKANFKQAEVFHVGRPDDGGVDVVFVDSGTKHLIQVKRRSGCYKGEGVEVVRNLLGTMLLEKVLQGIVVSTADHFTYRAYQAIGRASEREMVVDLIDRGKLDRMLEPLLPKRAWRSVIASFDGSLNRYFVRKFAESKREPNNAGDKSKRTDKRQIELFE